MNITKNSKLTKNAQQLRREMTKKERRLWYDFLKNLPFSFRRQKVIGNYIVDFYCADAKLVIELDGGQHYEEKGVEKDKERDAFLQALGLTVLRYSNLEILQNFQGVCEHILNFLSSLK